MLTTILLLLAVIAAGYIAFRVVPPHIRIQG